MNSNIRQRRIHLARAAAVTAMVAGGVVAGTAAPASADDDTRRVTGDCTGSSEYTFRLSDSGGELRNQSLRFFVNGERGKGRVWTLDVYVDGDKVQTLEKKTNRKGNVDFYDTFTADDDADVRVHAEAGYGEDCKRTLSLD